MRTPEGMAEYLLTQCRSYAELKVDVQVYKHALSQWYAEVFNAGKLEGLEQAICVIDANEGADDYTTRFNVTHELKDLIKTAIAELTPAQSEGDINVV